MELETSVNKDVSFVDWKIGSASHLNLASGFSIDYGDKYCNSWFYSAVPACIEAHTRLICCSTGKPILMKAKTFWWEGRRELEDDCVVPAMLAVLIKTVEQVQLNFVVLHNQDACVTCAILHHCEPQHTHTTPCRPKPQVPGLFLVSLSKI